MVGAAGRAGALLASLGCMVLAFASKESAALAPAAVEDCRCALRWVINNAEEYGFDADRIVVSGTSAGGHLTAMLMATR